MELLASICGFIAVWLLFSFPLYQGVLELSSPALTFWRGAHADVEHIASISPWYWLFPPLKVRKEKQRALTMIRQLNLTSQDLREIMNYLDKATAWFYVALAGLLNAIFVTYDLLERWVRPQSPWIFVVTALIMAFLGVGNVRLRMNSERIAKKISRLSGSDGESN